MTDTDTPDAAPLIITQEHAHMLLEVTQQAAEFIDTLGALIGRNIHRYPSGETLLTALSRVYVALEVAASDAQGIPRNEAFNRIKQEHPA